MMITPLFALALLATPLPDQMAPQQTSMKNDEMLRLDRSLTFRARGLLAKGEYEEALQYVEERLESMRVRFPHYRLHHALELDLLVANGRLEEAVNLTDALLDRMSVPEDGDPTVAGYFRHMLIREVLAASLESRPTNFDEVLDIAPEYDLVLGLELSAQRFASTFVFPGVDILYPEYVRLNPDPLRKAEVDAFIAEQRATQAARRHAALSRN